MYKGVDVLKTFLAVPKAKNSMSESNVMPTPNKRFCCLCQGVCCPCDRSARIRLMAVYILKRPLTNVPRMANVYNKVSPIGKYKPSFLFSQYRSG